MIYYSEHIPVLLALVRRRGCSGNESGKVAAANRSKRSFPKGFSHPRPQSSISFNPSPLILLLHQQLIAEPPQ